MALHHHLEPELNEQPARRMLGIDTGVEEAQQSGAAETRENLCCHPIPRQSWAFLHQQRRSARQTKLRRSETCLLVLWSRLSGDQWEISHRWSKPRPSNRFCDTFKI
jgi:hypothetical protein